jgi:hypothetical protein
VPENTVETPAVVAGQLNRGWVHTVVDPIFHRLWARPGALTPALWNLAKPGDHYHRTIRVRARSEIARKDQCDLMYKNKLKIHPRVEHVCN